MDDLIERLQNFSKAYPEDMFPPLTAEETKQHSRIVTLASAGMGRHFAKFANEAAAELARLTDELAKWKPDTERGGPRDPLAVWYDRAIKAEGEVERLRADADLALDLLVVTFDAYENGTPCYEDPDENEGYCGNAVRLDDDTFHKCADLLNRTRPKPCAAIKEAGNG